MLNFQEIPDSVPVHCVKTMKYVRDVGLFLTEITDMGCGISVFHFEVPDGESIENLIVKFQSSEKIRHIATPISHFSKNHPDAKTLRSIEHLGERNCYMGFFHCGADEVDKYRFVVCSYDMQSSLAFHRRIIKQIEKTFANVSTEKDFAKAESYRVPAANLMEGSQYLQSIYRGYLNRRVIAASVFQILGISFDKEEYRDEQFGGKITDAVRTHDVLENYEIVCLVKKDSYAQFYNRCMRTQDLYNGAPWFLAPHRGYYSFYQSGTNTVDFKEMIKAKKAVSGERETPNLNVFVPDAAPLGIPRGFVNTSESVNLTIQKQISTKIMWTSDMNIMMYADPKLFQPLDKSFNELEEMYNLSVRRFHLWKTLVMYVSPPPPGTLNLRVMVKFSTQSTLRIPFLHYREILHMYNNILNYTQFVTEKEASMIFKFPDRKDKTKVIPWDISQIPKLSELYKHQSDDLMETSMNVDLLHILIHAFDAIEIIMEKKLEHTGVFQSSQPSDMLNAMLEHKPEGMNTKKNNSKDMNLEFSDFEITGSATESDAPIDELSRDGPAKSIKYNINANIPSSSDERLGDSDMGGSSAVSDIESSRVFGQNRSYREIPADSKYKKYMRAMVGDDLKKPTQTTEDATDISDENNLAKRRRRRKKIREVYTKPDVANYYTNNSRHEISLTSEDDTIFHKN